MTEKEKELRRLARQWRRADKAQREMMASMQRRGDEKHSAFMQAMEKGITYDELHEEIKLQNEEEAQ